MGPASRADGPLTAEVELVVRTRREVEALKSWPRGATARARPELGRKDGGDALTSEAVRRPSLIV